MAAQFCLRFIFIMALIYFHCQAAFLPNADEYQPGMEMSVKRTTFKKLRPNNPLLIYHQSIKQP